MKKSTALRKAKKYLSSSKRMGICEALDDAYADGCISELAFDLTCDMIQERIEPFRFADEWLAWRLTYGDRVAPRMSMYQLEDGDRLQYEITLLSIRRLGDAAIQEWRRRWMDKMIAELEGKGE